MTPERERNIRVALARYVQAQMQSDYWRREAAKRRDLLAKLMHDARETSPDMQQWPYDLAAIAAFEKEMANE